MDTGKPLDDPSERRWLLLTKALECRALDQALDLAREAYRFVIDGVDSLGMRTTGACTHSSKSAEGSEGKDIPDADPPLPTGRQEISRLVLSPEQRDQLRERLAQGADNASLAKEFGLAPRQVQGVRMSAARKSRHQRQGHLAPVRDHLLAATVDEVIRYLRQQDDVVVPDGNGTFLVNGRFDLSPLELVARANRMRIRQKKPPFDVAVAASERSVPGRRPLQRVA